MPYETSVVAWARASARQCRLHSYFSFTQSDDAAGDSVAG